MACLCKIVLAIAFIAAIVTLYNWYLWRKQRKLFFDKAPLLWDQWIMIWKYMAFSNIASRPIKVFIWPITGWLVDNRVINSSVVSIPKWSKKHRFIVFNHVWIAQICCRGEEQLVEAAFNQTLYHELGHLANDFLGTLGEKQKDLTETEMRFVRYVEEVFCDFFGAMKSGNVTDTNIDEIIDFKMGIDAKLLDTDIEAVETRKVPDHPTWKNRRKWLHKKAFDRKLLELIAEDIGYGDSAWLIDRLLDHYPKIDLDIQ